MMIFLRHVQIYYSKTNFARCAPLGEHGAGRSGRKGKVFNETKKKVHKTEI
jgi:hypothetical protein